MRVPAFPKRVLLGTTVVTLAAVGILVGITFAAVQPQKRLLYSLDQAKQELGFGKERVKVQNDHAHSFDPSALKQVAVDSPESPLGASHMPELFQATVSKGGTDTVPASSWTVWTEGDGVQVFTISGPDESFLTIRRIERNTYVPIVADIEWQRTIETTDKTRALMYRIVGNPFLRIRGERVTGQGSITFDVISHGLSEDDLHTVFQNLNIR